MNIDKIRNYNQTVLAIIFTLVLGGAVIGIIGSAISFISKFLPDKHNKVNILLADDKVDDLSKDSLRRQIISYSNPKLVDTNNLIYLLSVNVLTLEKSEKFSGSKYEELVEATTDESSLWSKRKHPSVKFYGSFNNLLLYDYKKQITEKLCNDRIIGSDLSFEYFNDEILVVFTGADTDTDGDGQITLTDFNAVFVYSLNDKRLRKIKLPNATVRANDFVGNEKDLLITFGVDRNKDKEFDQETEPEIIMKYDFQNDKLQKVVNPILETELQKIVDKI